MVTELATAWAAIDEGVRRVDVADRPSTIERGRIRFVRQWSFLGDDPVDAADLNAAIDQRVHSTNRILSGGASDRSPAPENALTIGGLAGVLERVRFSIQDADDLCRRFTKRWTVETTSSKRPAHRKKAACGSCRSETTDVRSWRCG